VAGSLCFWPSRADPRSWPAPTPPGYVGAHRANTRLAVLRTIGIGREFGPEHIAIGPDGKLYAAMTSGSLLRMDPDGGRQEVFANTGGRVLGFAFDAEGRMIAADAMHGLLAITPDARVAVLTDRVSANDPIRYANSIVVASDGAIFFTDASGRFAPREWGGT
jgi:sugar lactone lactonase YvrE